MLYNWRSGATFLPDIDTATSRGDQVEDLSTPALLRELCNPLRRVASEQLAAFPGGAFLPYVTEGRYGLTYNRSLLVGPELWQGIRLERCGSGWSTVLSAQPAGSAQLGGREASWLSARVTGDTVSSATAVLYSLARRTAVEWPVQATRSAAVPEVAHTHRRIFVSAPSRTVGAAFDIWTGTSIR
ncbi:MAG: hypothetical protein JHC95_10455 [Solirubrobacteraceae bacterium]|nr:hypothetical protein [Solirubrobacteraceae bacterium]